MHNNLKKVVSILLCVLALGTATWQPTFAATPTPAGVAASPESTSSSQVSLETTQKLKQRIEKIVEERRDQIMGAVTNFGKTRKGFIGEIQRVSAETITIKTNKGPQILSLNEEVIITKAGKPIEITAMTVGDWAMVIGTIEDDTFTPELIDLSSKSLRPKTKLVLIGSIKEIITAGKSKTLSSLLIVPRTQNGEQKLTLTKQTEYFDSDGNPLKTADLETEMQAVVVAQEGTNGMEITSLKLLGAIGGAR